MSIWLASRISSMPPPALQPKLSPRSMRGLSIASCRLQVGLAGGEASSSRHSHLSSVSEHFSHLLRIRPYARRLRIGCHRRAPFESTVMPKQGPRREHTGRGRSSNRFAWKSDHSKYLGGSTVEDPSVGNPAHLEAGSRVSDSDG